MEGEINLKISLQGEFWKVARKNEPLLRQKSRSKWMMEGDQNTKFLHATINSRWQKNLIPGLKIEERWEEVKKSFQKKV